MDAKEYLEKNQQEWYCYFSDGDEIGFVVEVMEEYHQAKSKEEAGERYGRAYSYYNKETYMNGKSITAVVNALRIASGKEES